MRRKNPHLVLCIDNRGYPASLELQKAYTRIPDREGELHGMIRVVDESGEDYLFPREYFRPIKVLPPWPATRSARKKSLPRRGTRSELASKA